MKKVKDCNVQNCIETPTECSTWNGGDIVFLKICNGDSLNTVVWEIVGKLQDIAGDDLSSFDIDSILSICNQQAPSEITLLSILNVLKNNDICIKDYIDTLTDRVNAIANEGNLSVNLKCFADIDNLGNVLAITREALDQLVIDQLCSQKARIDSLEGNLTTLQNQVDSIDVSPVVNEPSIATCINAALLPTSQQVINTAQAHCDLEDATGDPIDIAAAIANTPSPYPSAVTTNPDYIASPGSWADNYSNLLLAFKNLMDRVLFMEENCCAVTCADVELGFSAVFSDASILTIRFTAGAGTNIPAGWTSVGSSVTITDKDGDTVTENITISNNSEHDISILGLNLDGELTVSVTAIMTNGSLVCEKCLAKTITVNTGCEFCQICVSGSSGSAVVIYTSSSTSVVIENSTTTTTTAAL
jgi:hypothetical protein